MKCDNCNSTPTFVKAAKSGELCRIPVSLMDGHVKSVLIDSATTAKELCQIIADKVGVKDLFGFSVYFSIFGKVKLSGDWDGCLCVQYPVPL